MSSESAFDWRANDAHHDAQQRMAALEPYYQWVLDLMKEHLRSPVADAGAGSGHFASLLQRNFDSVLLLEGGEQNLQVLRSRFANAPNVEVADCDLTQCRQVLLSREVQSIVTLDVLEHLPDDAAVLRQFHEALPVNGNLLIKVPALTWLYGPVDRASGHYRRYSRQSLQAVVVSAGFEIVRCTYMNLAAVPMYFLKSRILKSNTNFSRTFTAAQLGRIRRSMPFIRLIDQLTGPIVGLSLVLIARKPG